MATAQEVIRKFVGALGQTGSRGRQALDEAVRASTGFSSWQAVIDAMVSDASAYGSRFLSERCGIRLDNSDTGAISGADAGSGIVKTAESVVPEDGAFLFPSGGTATIQGLNVRCPDWNTLSYKQQLIVGALNSWWINNSLSLISGSYGLGFQDGTASVRDIEIRFVQQNSGTLAYVSYATNLMTGKCTSLSLNINMNYYGNINETDPNGTATDTSFYLDRTIAHEMTHAAFVANVRHAGSLPYYFLEGIAELTHGIDDERGISIRYLAGNPSYLERILKDNVRAGTDSYAAGYILLRYFAQQASLALPEGASVRDGTMTLSDSLRDEIWLDRSAASTAVVTVDGRQTTGNLLVAGNDQSNLIAAGNGTSSLWGGRGGTDTLVGGGGADMFWYGIGEGNDIILGSDASDSVNLYNVRLEDIISAGTESAKVTVALKNGETLTVNGSVTDFTLGDGSAWVTDHAGNWTKKG